MLSSVLSTAASCGGLFTSQSFWGARRMRAPLAPPRLSDPRNVEAEAQAVETSCDTDNFEAKIAFLRAAISLASIRLYFAAGMGSCQINSSFGTSGPR